PIVSWLDLRLLPVVLASMVVGPVGPRVAGEPGLANLRSAPRRRIKPKRVWLHFVAKLSPFAPQDACAGWPHRGGVGKGRERLGGVHETAIVARAPGPSAWRFCIAPTRHTFVTRKRRFHAAWSRNRARLSVLPSTASTSKIPGEVAR